MGIQPEIKVKSRGREREKRRERERHGGSQIPKKLGWETSRRNWSILYCSKAFYTFDKTWRSMGNTKLCSVCWPDSYENQAFLSAYLIVYTSLRSFTSSSSQKGQLTFYSLFSEGLSTRRLICVDLPKVWCHSQKALNKVTFLHSKIQQFITSERSTGIYNQRKVINSKV